VYELDELVQLAKSTSEDAQHIVNHLIKKLESKNPVVKAKVHSLPSTPISDLQLRGIESMQVPYTEGS